MKDGASKGSDNYSLRASSSHKPATRAGKYVLTLIPNWCEINIDIMIVLLIIYIEFIKYIDT